MTMYNVQWKCAMKFVVQWKIWSAMKRLVCNEKFGINYASAASNRCQQSQLSPVSCSPREAEARSWWEAPGSLLPSLKRFWIAWGFQDWNSSTWRQKVAQQQHGHGLPKARRQSAEDMVWIILIQSTLQYIQLKTLCWIHTVVVEYILLEGGQD